VGPEDLERCRVAVPTTRGGTSAGPLSAGHRLRRPGPVGSVLGGGARLRARAGPAGFATWNDYYRKLGLPEEDLIDGADRISDPDGHGPVIWFHARPDAKVVKNRLHFDIHASGDQSGPIEARRKRVDAEAARLAGLGATITGALAEEGLDHYAVGMKDPEGNEFDIN
jgi:hypothetical protein